MHRFYVSVMLCVFLGSCVASGDGSWNLVSPTGMITGTPTTPSSPEPTSMSSQGATLPLSVFAPGPPICPDLPRPAAVFQSASGEDYVLRHVASQSDCTMQFDPPIHRLLALTADGIYYSTRVAGEESTNQKFIHYANDGTRTEPPFFDVGDNISYVVISPSGSHVVWSLLRTEKTTENEEIVVSDLYAAKADGSQVRLLHSVDNAAEVKRGEPYIAWMIQPLRFVGDRDLLFTVQPDGKGGAWNAYTGRYSNLYRISVSGGESTLVYECPVDDHSDCIGDISPDNAYLTVTKREAGEITVVRMDDGAPLATYSGPGQDYIGFPSFGPAGDLAFMSADVGEDQITIEHAYISLVTRLSEEAAITLLIEPLVIGDWVNEQHIFYTAVGDQQTQPFPPSLVNQDGRVERLPETYSHFLGVLP